MIAFHSDEKIKAAVIRQLRSHEEADEIVKGRYWEGGKGCAVGCTIHSGEHVEYETRFGIPQVLARLEDLIFEGLPNAEAKHWPILFMSAIRTGADLSLVHWRFLHWMLTDENVNPGIEHPLVKEVVKRCADLMADLAVGKTPPESAAESARSAAWSAESVTRSTAWSAAWPAARSAARSVAESVGSEAARKKAYSLMAEKLLNLLKEAV
jgi:hypothetical protein